MTLSKPSASRIFLSAVAIVLKSWNVGDNLESFLWYKRGKEGERVRDCSLARLDRIDDSASTTGFGIRMTGGDKIGKTRT